MTYIARKNRLEYISHHGIKGQRWGARNGPPYPLGNSDHSASERKAGWKSSIKGSPKIGNAYTDSEKKITREGRKRDIQKETKTATNERNMQQLKHTLGLAIAAAGTGVGAYALVKSNDPDIKLNALALLGAGGASSIACMTMLGKNMTAANKENSALNRIKKEKKEERL